MSKTHLVVCHVLEDIRKNNKKRGTAKFTRPNYTVTMPPALGVRCPMTGAERHDANPLNLISFA